MPRDTGRGRGTPPRRPAAAATRPAARPVPRRPVRLANSRRRVRALFVASLFVFSIFAAQLVRLQGIEASAVAQKGEAERRWTTFVPASRGSILDRNGVALASSVDRKTIVGDPLSIKKYEKKDANKRMVTVGVAGAAADLAPLVGASVSELMALLDNDNRYAVIATEITPLVWRKIDALGIPGVTARTTAKRTYPGGAATAPIVGQSPNEETYTGADGKVATRQSEGEGLESEYNEILRGTPGQTIKEYSLDGKVIPMGDVEIQHAVPGRDIKLTLDNDLNWFAYNAVAQQVKAVNADSGYVVVMDRKGRLLSAAQYPSYDPAKKNPQGTIFGSMLFRSVFEPGSTAKVMSIGAALDTDTVTPEEVFTVPNRLARSDASFRDSHDHKTERLTTAGILAQSSNIGTILATEKVPATKLESYYRGFGLGATSATGYPGETKGILGSAAEWVASRRYTVLFGQGLAISAIQAAGVYQAIANDGVRIPATLLAGSTQSDGTYQAAGLPKGQRVIKAETAAKLRRMMESVVGESGTAANAEIPGYRIAGKTGTSENYAGSYTSSFIGLAPAENPQVIVAVIVNNPRKGYYGGAVAGPVFKQVMTQALKVMGVAPSTTAAKPYALTEKAAGGGTTSTKTPARPATTATTATTKPTTKATTKPTTKTTTSTTKTTTRSTPATTTRRSSGSPTSTR